ncbi:alpha/beta hydrolase [Pseudomonas sp. Gutcm_11s]|uniref:alpha/beta hydrolase n=1 Tax=Pseudomonas sp. Gutcm_11s TaxID=3026088 RepID=UPI00235F94C0|nr:alpha/beta hydrolase [Pseudomonas sp. Gutcm_11s]MDD0843924.1 alpha/beta hydrolase [Pseudomonas sp. Gutcm_11s]
MNWSVELPAASTGQRLLTAMLRASTRLVFRTGMHPWLPPSVQRRVLRLATLSAPRARGVSIETGQLGGVPCEWLCSSRDNGWVLLYLHGGAFMVGSPQTHRAITTCLAAHSGARICALDYRLAPEHPWPAAADDALAAYRALLEQGQPAERIVIAGDSAGGQLTLSTALRLRDAGLPLPAALVCFSPVTDLSGATWHEPPAGDPLLSGAWLEQGVAAYCPSGVDRGAPLLSPLNTDLSGLPPLLVQVGEDEHLLSQSLRLRDSAGLDLRLEVYPGQWHVFQINCALLQVARLAMQRVVEFLQEKGCR